VNLSAATGGTVVFNGTFSGASQNVVVNGYQEPFSGIIVMGASNTYTGSTYISGGTLEINPGGSSNGSANFYLGEVSGVQTATLALGGTAGGQTLNNAITVRAGSTGAKTISSLATSSTSTLGGGITLDDNLTVTSASGGTLALTGNITSGASAALTGTFNNAGSVSISGTIGGGAGAIAVTQSGAGTTTLSAANTYAGATTVNAGTLMVTGSLNGTSGASVAAGATFEVDGLLNAGATTTVNGTLRGTGSVGAITANGGAIAAGLTVANSQTATPGTLTAAGAVNLSGSTTFSIRLGMVSGATGDNDQLAVNSGSISLNGANLQLNIGSFLDHSGNLGHTYVIINGGAGLTGLGGDIFAGLAEGAAINAGSGYQLTVDYASSASGGALGSGSDVVLQLGVVPEPGACGMVLGGAGVLLGFQGMRRRRAVRVS
jgi:autotransporter-associated beta strand protein